MASIKKWDSVLVIAGNHKWTTSVVERVSKGKYYVKDVNASKRAKKQSEYKEILRPIDVSNLKKVETKATEKKTSKSEK